MKRRIGGVVCLMLLSAGIAWAAGPASAPLKLPAGVPRNRLSRATARALELVERDPYWLRARESALRSVRELDAQHEAAVARGIAPARVMRGDCPEAIRRKWIALTFDDGPHPAFTPRILDFLRRSRIRATFFVVGEMAERYPELVRAEAANGNSLGNHTYHHVSLPKIPVEYIATELDACGEVLKSITGRTPRLFRPPGGDYDQRVTEAAEALGYTTVLWTDDPGDYASPGAQVIASRTLRDAEPGGIILLHDGIEQTIDVLPSIVERLRKQGYNFVTLDEMLAAGPPSAHSPTAARRNLPARI